MGVAVSAGTEEGAGGGDAGGWVGAKVVGD
jgi:hypothetical protein